MRKYFGKPLLFLLLVLIVSTCIDPFFPELNEFESYLVVDALLTNENSSYYVKLSRTREKQFTESSMISGAQVTIKDELGNSRLLQETGEGIYKTDSLTFQGETGISYILNIITPEGVEYESDPCVMYPVEQIESIYYNKDQLILDNGSEIQDGIRIYIDSKSGDESKYLRWAYNEWWKIIVPNPQKFEYINDSTFLEVEPIKQICWGYSRSDEIIIHSTQLEQSNSIAGMPILFVSSNKTNRFLIQHCIEVEQYSLSKKEYEFWDHMKQINESGGDIFEKQPFSIISNIHNTSDPDEPVLGYFQVSAVSQKKLYITPDDISELGLPLYSYNCVNITLGPDDFPPPLFPGDGMTFSRIYNIYSGPEYSFIEPIFNETQELKKFVFSSIDCSDCTLNGSLAKPDFWIDLK